MDYIIVFFNIKKINMLNDVSLGIKFIKLIFIEWYFIRL